MPLPAGTHLGPYEIESLIGSGGMGHVYRARDTRLDRAVAIKQLTVDQGDGFRREARAIAALNHPNICQVYDVGDDYLVLEYLDGAPPQGPLPAEQAVRLGIQIASALEAAHQRGILHRDLKPANIIVLPNGTAKLLDFGIATSIDNELEVTQTHGGGIVGTVAYMSPEQAMGQTLDARSDVFSFGAVLYELLTGRRAFTGDTTIHVLSAVLRDDPPPAAASGALKQVLAKCLAKAPGQRFQTMSEVRAALEDLGARRAEPPQASIAVLPFADLSGDKENEYFGDGLAEEILNALAQVPGLKVIARTSAFAFKGRNEDVRGIAHALGVTSVLEGSVRRSGNRVRVTAQLIAAEDGSHMWSERYDRSMADVFAMQDEIAGSITAALKVKLAAAAGPRHYTPSLPAYELFLKGRHHLIRFTPDSWARARTYFEEAIAEDPGYAEPHAELGLGYFISGMHGMQPMREVAPMVRAEAQRALDLDPADVRPRFLLGAAAVALDYDWAAAAGHFQAAMAATNVQADARWVHASLYLGALGRFEESANEMARAVEQDPLNPTWRAIWAAHLIHGGLHQRAIEEATKGTELDENYFVPYQILGEAYLASGRIPEAIAAFERAHQLAPWNALPTALLAATLLQVGETTRADAVLARLGAMPSPVWGRVLYHLLLSELDAAADWYETMIEHRDPFALVYVRAPITRALRMHPRWPRLAELMRLPHTPH